MVIVVAARHPDRHRPRRSTSRSTRPTTRVTRLLNTTVRNLAGVPAVVYGLLGLAVFVALLSDVGNGGRNLLAGGLTLAIVVLPIVIITAAEALRAVPATIREAGFGVGATKWEVVRSHVLPYAAPGIFTGIILTIARAFGETAPLLLVGAAAGWLRSGRQRDAGRAADRPVHGAADDHLRLGDAAAGRIQGAHGGGDRGSARGRPDHQRNSHHPAEQI